MAQIVNNLTLHTPSKPIDMIPRDIAHKDDLRLDIASPLSWQYSPGDTIIGNAIRQSPIISPEATLKVWLTGMMRVRILRERGTHPGDIQNDYENYTNKWTLFNPTGCLIFSGPLHHPENSKQPFHFPFSVVIPSNPRLYITQGHQPQASFVPFDRDHEAYHILPGSLRTPCDGFNSISEAIIEYRLHACLRHERGGSQKSQYTSVPISLKHHLGNTDQLHTSKGFLSQPTGIRSQRLLPGMENQKLSFRQRSRKFLGSSKVPELWLQVYIESPPIIKFNDPEPLPISLSINPLKGKGGTSESPETLPQNIQITSMKIAMRSCTAVVTPGKHSSAPHKDQQSFDVDFHFEDVLRRLDAPLVANVSDKPSESISIGQMFKLVLRKDGLYSNGRRCSSTPTRPLFPVLFTFAIKHTHLFFYRIILTVVGETHEVKIFAPVKILEAAAG